MPEMFSGPQEQLEKPFSNRIWPNKARGEKYEAAGMDTKKKKQNY
jgi:hypothetical protein